MLALMTIRVLSPSEAAALRARAMPVHAIPPGVELLDLVHAGLSGLINAGMQPPVYGAGDRFVAHVLLDLAWIGLRPPRAPYRTAPAL